MVFCWIICPFCTVGHPQLRVCPASLSLWMEGSHGNESIWDVSFNSSRTTFLCCVQKDTPKVIILWFRSSAMLTMLSAKMLATFPKQHPDPYPYQTPHQSPNHPHTMANHPIQSHQQDRLGQNCLDQDPLPSRWGC